MTLSEYVGGLGLVGVLSSPSEVADIKSRRVIFTMYLCMSLKFMVRLKWSARFDTFI